METGYTTRTTCRVCGSPELTPLFSLGEHYVSNFIEPGSDLSQYPKCPIRLELCNDCTLVQLKDTAPQELLYSRHYWYKSSTSETMRGALRELACVIHKLLDLKPHDVVLDIGSNDGTFLRSFPVPIIKVGCEPARNFALEGSQGINYYIPEFWAREEYYRRLGQKAKVITALGMFYDLEDPNQFIADVAEVLADDGLFIAQLMCLKNMVNINDVGNLCHEHLEFYSCRSLETLMEKHGLEIFDVTQNRVNGQSYRLYIRHKGAKVPEFHGAKERVTMTIAAEAGLEDPVFYRDWFWRMECNKARLVDLVKGLVANEQKVWVYGASTKGNTILQYLGLDNKLIEKARDASPEKWGKVTIGTNIPIIGPQDVGEGPDYYLVLPYAFLPEFKRIEAEQPWRLRGGKFIVPLPEMYLC